MSIIISPSRAKELTNESIEKEFRTTLTTINNLIVLAVNNCDTVIEIDVKTILFRRLVQYVRDVYDDKGATYEVSFKTRGDITKLYISWK